MKKKIATEPDLSVRGREATHMKHPQSSRTCFVDACDRGSDMDFCAISTANFRPNTPQSGGSVLSGAATASILVVAMGSSFAFCMEWTPKASVANGNSASATIHEAKSRTHQSIQRVCVCVCCRSRWLPTAMAWPLLSGSLQCLGCKSSGVLGCLHSSACATSILRFPGGGEEGQCRGGFQSVLGHDR